EIVRVDARLERASADTHFAIAAVRQRSALVYRCAVCERGDRSGYGSFRCRGCADAGRPDRICVDHAVVLDGALLPSCPDHRPACRGCATIPPELTEPLDTLGTLLEQLRAARQNGAWDTGRRIAWVAELATAMDALVVALKTLPDVRRPPGDPASTAPPASGPDEHAQEPPTGPHGATPAPVPPRDDGYDRTETGPYAPASAAYTPTAPEPDRQTPTTTPLFRYRGEE
ncbi:hypothetical protein ABZZ80_45865, partial [Streptomyces sp. NPDC006356]